MRQKVVEQLEPLAEDKSPLVAFLLGMFFGALGVGIYFKSWNDFFVCFFLFIFLTFVIPGLGAVPDGYSLGSTARTERTRQTSGGSGSTHSGRRLLGALSRRLQARQTEPLRSVSASVRPVFEAASKRARFVAVGVARGPLLLSVYAVPERGTAQRGTYIACATALTDRASMHTLVRSG